MKKVREIPENLKDLQEFKRNQTKVAIQQAIDVLNSEGGVVTKRELIKLTGLSASVFSKKHVKDVLSANKVCQYLPRKAIEREGISLRNDRILSVENEKLKLEIIRLKNIIIEKDSKILSLEIDLSDTKDKYMRLLGKLYQLQKKAEIKGITID
ncbi:MAG: hypothetical protein WBI17_14725 [Clostridiaceae bacterium]